MEHRSPSGANASDRQQIFDRDGHTEQCSVLMVPSGNSLASTVEAQCRQGVDNGIDFRNARFQYIEQFSAADRFVFELCPNIPGAGFDQVIAHELCDLYLQGTERSVVRDE